MTVFFASFWIVSGTAAFCVARSRFPFFKGWKWWSFLLGPLGLLASLTARKKIRKCFSCGAVCQGKEKDCFTCGGITYSREWKS
jgi:hypothetical protein